MKNIKPGPQGEAQEVKIKVRINSNGVIQLTSANLVEKKPKEEVPNDNGNTETNMDVAQEVHTLLDALNGLVDFVLEFFSLVFILTH